MTDWADLARRASFASHRLIGWIFWDPTAKDNLAALGVPDGLGHYIVNRAAPLAAAGPDVVTSSFFSIKREFVHFALAHAAPHVDWHDVTVARDAAVRSGLERMAPEIMEPLGALADELWRTVDAIPAEGRVLFAAHKAWPRPSDPVQSAWNAVNTIREWRGDVHWALLVSEEIDAIEAGVLHDAWMGYPDHWLPKSRGADEAQIAAALERLAGRGFATSDGVTAHGIEFRDDIERRTDMLCAPVWRMFGEENTLRLLEIVEPVGARFLDHINETAGDFWMPAARTRRI
ncbi:MAG: SCO6745 family protein [Ilumatobacteraceae bacterium]